MTSDSKRTMEEAAIRTELDAISNAVRTKDVDSFLARCAPDAVIFDMLPPLKQQGADAIRRSWAEALAAFEGPVEYDLTELEITIGDDVAFSRSFNRFGGHTTDGRHVINWLRTTLGFRKIEGRWRLVHEHVSVPMDMQSGLGMTKLEP